MLEIIVGEEGFDQEKEEFILIDPVTLKLEHSLVSLSKWESIFEKPFLTAGNKTEEEFLVYIQCMVLDDDFPPEVFSYLSEENLEQINAYIEKKHTATWFSDQKRPSRHSEVITAELIYYWLSMFKIPFEVQYWHLNRLFTLIRVHNEKANTKPMSKAEIASRQRTLNEQRKKELGTTG